MTIFVPMSEKRPTLVITGATGFIGSLLASFFAAHGWNVIALVRHAPEKHSRNILYSKYDLASGEQPILPDEIDVFIHAGYIRQEDHADAFQLNVESAKHLLRAVKMKNAKQLVFLSSLSADADARSVYGRQKAAIEKLFLAEKGTVVRAGLVLGDGGLFASMREYLRHRNLVPLFGNGNQPIQTVFIDDLVSAIALLVEKNLAGKFIVATDEPVPYRRFYLDLAHSLGAAPHFLRVPFWLAKLALSAGKLLGMKLPVTKDNLLGLQQMKRIPSADDLKKIGVTLRNYKESFLP